jgi:hypothetical protein
LVVKRLPKADAYRALEAGGNRHARTIAAGQIGSRARLFAPELSASFEAECQCMRDFITEAETSERTLERIASALRTMLRDQQFCVLIVSEGLVTIPTLLVHRLQGTMPEAQGCRPPGKVLSGKSINRETVGGICPDVLEVLRDIPVKSKMFGLLQKVLPARQLEIARLMVAMDRVGLTCARMLIALTPQAMLARDFHPTTITSLTASMRCAMALELERLSLAVLSAVERRGQVALELVAAGRYFDRLMDNSRVVRYLARNFPGHFEEFHVLSMPCLK